MMDFFIRIDVPHSVLFFYYYNLYFIHEDPQEFPTKHKTISETCNGHHDKPPHDYGQVLI